MRYSGADPKIPRGLAQQFPYMAKSDRYKEINVKEGYKFKPGDFGLWLAKSGGGHAWVCIGDKLIVEANHTSKYFLHVDTDNWKAAGRKEFHCYRMVKPIRKYIMKGDSGSEIKKLQGFLNWYGSYNLKKDGVCGKATEAAIKDFQTKEGLTPDGKFGEKSLKKAKNVKK